uniref:G_PROTEIN_RECEP_F1_2 domain-containing protein n=1 Tax=Steinernema glaseri TaxID=37863 RepID=A0A1I7XW98_9BILA
MTPYCDYLVIPGQFLSQYDLSKPWTATVAEIGSVSLVSIITMTLVAYVSIITYLVYLQK